MENIFNYNRFVLLVRNHVNENKRLFMLAVICMFIPAILIRIIFSHPEPKQLYVFYIAFLVYTGMIYTGLFFKRWTNKSRAMSFFMLPVTVFERIAVILFFTIVIFIPIFTLVYYCSNLIIFKISNPSLTFSIAHLFEEHNVLSAFCLYVFLPFTLIQSFLILCAVSFKKNQILIALIIFGFVLLLLSNLLRTSFLNTLTGGNVSVFGSDLSLFPVNVSFRFEDGSRVITSQLISNISYLVYGIMTLLFYMASYFKLKEKEI